MDMRFSWSRQSISAITGPHVADSPVLSLPSPERHLRDSHNGLVRQPEGCPGYSRYAIAGADETAHQYFQKNEDLGPKKKVRFFEEFWLIGPNPPSMCSPMSAVSFPAFWLPSPKFFKFSIFPSLVFMGTMYLLYLLYLILVQRQRDSTHKQQAPHMININKYKYKYNNEL